MSATHANGRFNPEFLSLFVPRVPNDFEVGSIIQGLGVGVVCRVDLVVSEKNPSLRAYVHLNQWCDTDAAQLCHATILSHGSCKVFYKPEEYLILRRMTCKPVPETKMNIHQLAHMVAEQAARIEALEGHATTLAKPPVDEASLKCYASCHVPSVLLPGKTGVIARDCEDVCALLGQVLASVQSLFADNGLDPTFQFRRLSGWAKMLVQTRYSPNQFEFTVYKKDHFLCVVEMSLNPHIDTKLLVRPYIGDIFERIVNYPHLAELRLSPGDYERVGLRVPVELEVARHRNIERDNYFSQHFYKNWLYDIGLPTYFKPEPTEMQSIVERTLGDINPEVKVDVRRAKDKFETLIQQEFGEVDLNIIEVKGEAFDRAVVAWQGWIAEEYGTSGYVVVPPSDK
jgi:hypothetical protein